MKRPADDEALVGEWLGEHPTIELNVTYLPLEQQWLVAAYLVGSRQIHGWDASPVAVTMHKSLSSAMLAAVNEAENKGA